MEKVHSLWLGGLNKYPFKFLELKMTEEDQEIKERNLMKKYAEESLERKSKPRIPWNYNCSVKIMKFQVKKEPLIKQVTCQKCGKTYKTNRDTKLCFDCEKK
jgi:hypothetical protein